MFGIRRWSSIRWKIVFIYFLLVFIAMTIIGVFIINQLEAYHMDSVRRDFRKIVDNGILVSFEGYSELSGREEEIQSNIEAWGKSIREEIFVIDRDFRIIADATASKSYIGQNAIGLLEDELIVKGLNGQTAEKDGVSAARGIPVKSMVFPIVKDGSTIGVLYLRADISSVYDALDKSRMIFIKSMLLALAVTVLLGFLIARSITVPINDVTEKAEKMAQGDFSQEVAVKSDDEIGRLAEMFNLLKRKLNITLSEISNEKSKLETIMKYMADGLIAVDLAGRIIHANAAAMSMLKLTREEIDREHYDDIVSRFSQELTLSAMKEKSAKWEGAASFDFDGSTFFARFARFKDEKETDVGIILMIQDITERQKLENMQREFVANVSHELKTPLTTIKSYTETLLDGALTDIETSRGFLTVVDDEADRMTRLVRDLLQLSRLDYNREKWNKRENNLITILRNTITKIEFTAKSKNQKIESLFSDDEKLKVFSDKDKLEQVMLNILSNAIKYTQDGGTIRIDARQEGHEARIEVSDNGIGIPEGDLPMIFERFYRVDKARARSMGGTGLGLSIARQIIEEHKGTIDVESIDGNGTKVIIRLPLAGEAE